MNCGYFLMGAFLLCFSCVPNKKTTKATDDNTFEKLKGVFKAGSDSIQTSVYWYWISDNISKEGVVKDLESMKKVGINRAFIGNIWQNDVPAGKVKFLSEQWWEILHVALKTASDLNIEIGLFNSPGWSQSGGPWVKPEQSMRYLTSTKMTLHGPLKVNVKLDKPEEIFQDVKLIAYPVNMNYSNDIRHLKPAIFVHPRIKNIERLVDYNDTTSIVFKKGESFNIDISTELPYTVRSLTIIPANSEMLVNGDLQIESNGLYKTIKSFTIDRSNDELIVGFKPFGPAVVSIPTSTSKKFRLILSSLTDSCSIAEIKLSSTPMVENYIEKSLAKMWQTPFPLWDAYQWERQSEISDPNTMISESKVIDISKYMTGDGRLVWNVPEGTWIVERCGMTPTRVVNGPASPEGTGLETDKLSKEHIASHFENYLKKVLERIPENDRKTWRIAVQDSYETGGQNWTDKLIIKFKESYGYDPISYLPVLNGTVIESYDKSDRFLWDLRRFVADNLSYQYVAGLREVCHKYGLSTWLENYGHWGFPGEFLQYGGQSDEVAGEFWSEGDLGNIENRAASSAAHIYGKSKVSSESFTCAYDAFSRYPAMMKQRADRFFTEGINNTLLHVYISQPQDRAPGINAFFGNEFNRLNTWFFDMDIFLQYIKRCNFMLQQGTYVAEVAYFIGEDVPKMTGTQNPELPRGYSFDYINAEVIKNRLSVENGKLKLPDGLSYNILVLPQLKTIRPELLLTIKDLVYQGAVILGPKPSSSPSLQNYPLADKQVQNIADELWGISQDNTHSQVRKVGKGLVLSNMNMQEALDQIKVEKDFKAEQDSVLFIHREINDGSIYFISNQLNKTININPEFRISKKQPELWNPVNGTVRDLPEFRETNNKTRVPIELGPMESIFLVFKKDYGKKSWTDINKNFPSPVKEISLNDGWLVKFDSSYGGPLNAVHFDTLADWTSNLNDSIRYYSGPALYKKSFQFNKLNAKSKIFIDLGKVSAIAKVSINGKWAGGVWTAPYELDITEHLKSGDNTIEIRVVNTWVNRLIGDSRYSKDKQQTWTVHNPYNLNSKLQSSGLLGPVSLKIL